MPELSSNVNVRYVISEAYLIPFDKLIYDTCASLVLSDEIINCSNDLELLEYQLLGKVASYKKKCEVPVTVLNPISFLACVESDFKFNEQEVDKFALCASLSIRNILENKYLNSCLEELKTAIRGKYGDDFEHIDDIGFIFLEAIDVKNCDNDKNTGIRRVQQLATKIKGTNKEVKNTIKMAINRLSVSGIDQIVLVCNFLIYKPNLYGIVPDNLITFDFKNNPLKVKTTRKCKTVIGEGSIIVKGREKLVEYSRKINICFYVFCFIKVLSLFVGFTAFQYINGILSLIILVACSAVFGLSFIISFSCRYLHMNLLSLTTNKSNLYRKFYDGEKTSYLTTFLIGVAFKVLSRSIDHELQ